MIFDEGLVRRVAWNTQQGRSVYFPIVFSQYDPTQIADAPASAPVFTFSPNTTSNSSHTLARTSMTNGTDKQSQPVGALPTGNLEGTGYTGNRAGSQETSGNFNSKRLPHTDRYGYWRQFGFGIVSIFHSDLMLVGGLDTTIEGWGKEDVDLFDKIVASNLTVFRAPDPGLVHVFHPIQCASSLSKEQAEMCRGTKLASTAAWQDLAARVEEKFPELL